MRIILEEGYSGWEPLDANDDGLVQWTVNIASTPGPDRTWVKSFKEFPSTGGLRYAPDRFRLWWGSKFTFECRECELETCRAALKEYVEYANQASEEEEATRQKKVEEAEAYERRIRERKRALDERYGKKG